MRSGSRGQLSPFAVLQQRPEVLMELLKRVARADLDINILKIRLDCDTPPGSDVESARVQFEISHGKEVIGRTDIGNNELGLPANLQEAKSRQSDETGFVVPDSLMYFLQGATNKQEALWLRLQQPYGYLPLVPWERLLTNPLQIPILRLPSLAVKPITPRETLSVAYCCSFPVAKQDIAPAMVIRQFVAQLPRQLRSRALIHVFGDEAVHGLLESNRDGFSRGGEVRIYDPNEGAARYNERGQSSDVESSYGQLESPWLLWMKDKLSGVSVDVVHFLCHGYLGRTRGGLAFAESPVHNEDRAWARIVDARQLSLFAEQVGAWAVVFSSPPSNYSIFGLRMLEQELSDLMPGPVLLHDMTLDSSDRALTDAFGYLLSQDPAPPPVSPALSLYGYPNWRGESQTDDDLNALVNEYTLQGQLGELFRGPEDVPSWLAAGQRSLERSVSKLTPEPEGDLETAAQHGIRDALQFTTDLFAKYARSTDSKTPRSTEAEEPDGNDQSLLGGKGVG